ncbi:MAG: peptidoglycan bridge formation glycyltransferase FemA/FemB family protein [Candidatus Colwellbacteria bacterium]|nr:peptidoglycan bridge formation glycyltransferase FemA/FemB family protein [Candidatus Colwellbacteria bacterium]
MLEVNEINNKNEWEGFLETRPEASFLQSWYWGELYATLGDKVQRTGFYRGSRLEGVMLSIVEDARRARYLIVPGGPIINWEDQEAIQAFISEITRIAKEEHCAFVRVRPQIEATEHSKKMFSYYGFRNAPMHLHAELTSQLDITRPEEELLTAMRKTTRYEIKKANSLGIKIITINDPEDIKEFYDLQLLTARRQRFVPFSYRFLYEQFRIFAEANKALLYSARLEEKLLAQAIIIFYGTEAVYHYGASTEDGRKYPGAYLLQWEAIKEAKKRGMKRYNFWGVSPPDNPGHRFYGISIFKRGFGGKDFEYLHAQDLVINYPRYVFNYVIENIRKKMRRV